jgi:hypothetical protein
VVDTFQYTGIRDCTCACWDPLARRASLSALWPAHMARTNVLSPVVKKCEG